MDNCPASEKCKRVKFGADILKSLKRYLYGAVRLLLNILSDQALLIPLVFVIVVGIFVLIGISFLPYRF